MSTRGILARFWRAALPAFVGALAGLLLVLYVVHPLGAKSLAPEEETTIHSASIASSGAYTAYLPLLSNRYNGEVPPFGVQFYGNLDADSGFGQIADAGANWVRLPLGWSRLEPSNTTPENYNWSGLDASVSNATGEEVQLILTLCCQPSWAAVYDQGPVTDTADIKEFIGAVVERYDGDGVDDAPGSPVVTHFELYNEPDNGDPGHAQHGGWGCWGDFDNDAPGCGDAEDYAALLQLLYPVIKEANPQAKLVFGGLALDWFVPNGPFDPDFLDNVLAACEGHNCFDVMNFHYYPTFRLRWDPYGRAIIGKATYVRERLTAHGFGDKPIICTETSWDSAASWGSDELQSRYAVKAYVRGMAADLDVVTWFWARDREPGGGPGLLDVTRQPKDSYRAFEMMTTMLRNAVYERELTLEETGDERIEGYVFETGKGRMDVVWVDDETPYVTEDDPFLPLMVEADTLYVVDKFGCKTEYRDEGDGFVDGKILVQVSGSPLFLEYGQQGDHR